MNQAAFVLLFLSSLVGSAVSAEEPKGKPAMTAEQRSKMAEAHEKMAVCLRSEKPMKDCHEEMRKACNDNKGEGCPMMGMKKGRHHHHDED